MGTEKSHEAAVAEFLERKFSGQDLIMIAERMGFGVGATMHVVHQLELQHDRWPESYRDLDYRNEEGS